MHGGNKTKNILTVNDKLYQNFVANHICHETHLWARCQIEMITLFHVRIIRVLITYLSTWKHPNWRTWNEWLLILQIRFIHSQFQGVAYTENAVSHLHHPLSIVKSKMKYIGFLFVSEASLYGMFWTYAS